MSTQSVCSARSDWGKLIDPYMVGGCTGLGSNSHMADADVDAVSTLIKDFCESTENVIVQNTNTLSKSDSLFYTPVIVGNKLTLGGMLDSGSMACTMSESAEAKLLDAGVLKKEKGSNCDVVLIGCGGSRVKPKSVYDVEMEVYGCKIIVPTLVVHGQLDDLIIGTNVIKHVIHQSKRCPAYWKALSHPCLNADLESEQFLSMLAGVERWKGGEIPDKIGTVRCTAAVCLEPGREYLLWGKLDKSCTFSPGSTVIIEPTTSRSAPRHVLVARLVSPLWGNGWVPLKLINMSHKQILLRRHAKIADVFACVALEDMEAAAPISKDVPLLSYSQVADSTFSHGGGVHELNEQLLRVGLGGLDINSCEVSDSCKKQLLDLVLRYEDIFSRHHLDCGRAEGFMHRIHVTDTRPFRLPYRRVPPSHYQVLRTVLNEMEERDIIRKSTSEFASPLVLVWKKNGDLRICTDFRWLNKRTSKDAYPLPHQADCLAALGGNCLFSTMDLTSGFYNMPLHVDDRKYSAFTTPMGLYEYNRLPQGLCNSPGSFMRMMTAIFGDQNFLSLLCYLDDLLVFAPNERTALERLEMVFSRLRGHNLKLSPKKCYFLRKSVKFLGHIVDETGVSTDPCKVESIARMTCTDLMERDGVTPSQKHIRSFLGMVNYYQHFIPKYSSIARPLFELLTGQTRRSKGGWRLKRSSQGRKLSREHWTDDHVRAFEMLKSSLLNSVVLAHPNFDQPFMLSTDASLDGLGAVLSQVQQGDAIARPIAFASKSLSRSQRNYPAHRLEFLALKWAVCDKFSHWLRGNKFTVCTDNNPLTHIMTKPKLDCCEQRWVAKLASYDFDIKYVPGSQNSVADALSRVPFVNVGHRLLNESFNHLRCNMKEMSDASVQNAFRQAASGADQFTHADSVVQNATLLPNDVVSAVLQSHNEWEAGARIRALTALQNLPQMVDTDFDFFPAYTTSELCDKQRSDKILSRVLEYVERCRRPSRRERAKEPAAVVRYLKHWEKFKIVDGVLYRVSRDSLLKTKRFQFVVPGSLRAEVMKGTHDHAGHQGQFRTLSLVRQRFFWLHFDRDVREYVRHCQRCVVSKTVEPDGRAPLVNIQSSKPLQIVCIDFWSAENSQNKSVDVLVVTDHFTRLAQAFPCKNQSAKEVARVLWDKYFCIYGFPERIHSDQGASFESNLISELLRVSGVKKSHTTPYHPMGNGAVERFNRTLGGMIRALPPGEKHEWPRRLQTLTFMYNCTVHETTGFAPFYLMFGRVPRLPVDMMFRSVLSDSTSSDYSKYVSTLSKDLSEAMHIAQKLASKEQHRHAVLYNRKTKGSNIEVSDRVLLANRAERGKKKVADRWESTVYTVVDKIPDTHTFRIRNTVTGQEKVVHRNLLLLANFLPVTDACCNDSTSLPLSSDVDADSPSATSENASLYNSNTYFTQDGDRDSEGNCSNETIHAGSDVDTNETAVDDFASIAPNPPESAPIMNDMDISVHTEATSSDPCVKDCTYRTLEWVSQLPNDNSDRADPGLHSEVSYPESAMNDSVVVDVMAGGSTTLPGQPSVNLTPSNQQCDVSSSQSVQEQVNDDVPSGFARVTSRFGRVINPVNRLIYTMSRQDVSYDPKSYVKTICRSVVQALRD